VPFDFFLCRSIRAPNSDRSAKVKIILLAILPNWDSLDSVRRAHSDLELAGLVFFALLVVAEALAHNSKQEERKHLFDSIGIWFFAIAVVCELAGYWYGQRNDFLSERVIISLDVKSREAFNNSSSALTKSSEAQTKADSAETTSGKAVAQSSSAMTIASGARREADSFEAEIKSATTQAADAESHLANALERAVAAEQEALRLKEQLADRTLSDAQLKSIAGKLAEYAGQEYDVTPYWDSPESVGIANRVHFALQMARWKFIPMTSWRALMGGLVGFKIDVHPNADEATLKAALDLTLALRAEGLEAKEEMQNQNSPKSNIISLSIGSKL
jgi:hypothetical protein